MVKRHCKVVVIPTGEACNFDYQVLLVDGEIVKVEELDISYSRLLGGQLL